MIVYDTDDDAYWIMHSDELDQMLPAIRDRLDEFHPGSELPDPVTLEQCRDALQLAFWEFEWRRYQPNGDLWTENSGTWEQVKARYPALFADGDTPPAPKDQEQSEEADLPDDLDWSFSYQLRQVQSPVLTNPDIDWNFVLTHDFINIKDVLTGQADDYIFDTIEHARHVAIAYDIVLRDGHITALATVHPTVSGRGDDTHPILDETIAKAELRLTFDSERTSTAVRAALTTRYDPDPTPDYSQDPDLLDPFGNLPVGLDMAADYTVLMHQSNHAVQIDWTAALLDAGPDLRAVISGQHTPITEIMGSHQAFALTLSVNDRSQVVAHTRLHPATGPDMNPNTDVVLALADIEIAFRHPMTAAAFHQYVTRQNPA